jgi:hypothetical protein
MWEYFPNNIYIYKLDNAERVSQGSDGTNRSLCILLYVISIPHFPLSGKLSNLFVQKKNCPCIGSCNTDQHIDSADVMNHEVPRTFEKGATSRSARARVGGAGVRVVSSSSRAASTSRTWTGCCLCPRVFPAAARRVLLFI